MVDYAAFFGTLPPWVQYVLIVVAIWELFWKGIALWKSAKNNQQYWFVAMLVLNTAGILPIIYLVFFEKKARRR